MRQNSCMFQHFHQIYHHWADGKGKKPHAGKNVTGPSNYLCTISSNFSRCYKKRLLFPHLITLCYYCRYANICQHDFIKVTKRCVKKVLCHSLLHKEWFEFRCFSFFQVSLHFGLLILQNTWFAMSEATPVLSQWLCEGIFCNQLSSSHWVTCFYLFYWNLQPNTWSSCCWFQDGYCHSKWQMTYLQRELEGLRRGSGKRKGMTALFPCLHSQSPSIRIPITAPSS